ncbi:LemA family protein [Candidatus Bipolaricaulota bacterium]|nr:LemA family protein [Candidatus Bipolaricaulota bacterium]
MIGWIIVGLFVLLFFWIALVYNRLVRLQVRAEEAWRGIDTLLRKRADLIPNVVETVKGYAGHEREVFEKVTEARSASLRAKTPREQGEADDFLSSTLKTLFAVVENYPELKANENFMSLQKSLEGLEEEIARSRRYYNAVVRDLNTAIKVFPQNLIANLFRIQEREFYTLPSEEMREPPKVSFVR